MMERPFLSDPVVVKVLGDAQRRAGLKLCAHAYLLSEAPTRPPEQRANALQFAERLLEKHGPAREGWLVREIERQRPAFDKAEADRVSAFAHLGPDRPVRPGDWSIYDIAGIATCFFAGTAEPLRRVELKDGI